MKQIEISMGLHDELIAAINKGCGSPAQKGMARNAADELFVSLTTLQMGPGRDTIIQEGWKTVTCLAPWVEDECPDWVARVGETAT
ncbi:hypothetical protein BVY04_01860 [bacterium M21]|nr:hypothetical protein BVY04_01860 [bacterium M21]